MTSKCPQCDKTADTGEENKARPFCSDRCRLLDLGKWLAGEYAIPGSPVVDPTIPGDDDEPLQ